MASTTKADLSVNGSDSLQKEMGRISDLDSTSHILEEKVLLFTGNVVSQHESSTQKSEQFAIANEPTSSKAVLEEDSFHSSEVFDEGEEELNKYLANEISSKGVSRRILEDELLERNINQNLPMTVLKARKFQDRTRSSQRNDEMVVKTGQVKTTSMTPQDFHSAKGKRSTEVEKKDKLFLCRSELGNTDKETESQRNHSDISVSSFSSPAPPARGKKKGSGTEKKEKTAQQNTENKNEKLKMILNNLVTEVSYSFQNALTLQEQHSQVINKSFLTFGLRREVRKVLLIKELIEEMETVTCRYQCHEEDFKDISETIESLHSSMREDLKDSWSEEIHHESQKYYLRFITVFSIIGCIMAAVGLTAASLEKWSGLVLFIFLVLVLFLVIKYLCKVKPLLHKN